MEIPRLEGAGADGVAAHKHLDPVVTTIILSSGERTYVGDHAATSAKFQIHERGLPCPPAQVLFVIWWCELRIGGYLN